MNDSLDSFQFERVYNRLFGNIIENNTAQDEEWRYDPLDSKYPTIDGILRRKTRKPAEIEHCPTAEKEEYVLVQLKGTRGDYAALRRLLDGAYAKMNQLASSLPAVLIGLIVDATSGKEVVNQAFIHAPTTDLLKARLRKEDPIEPADLAKRIASILDARAHREEHDRRPTRPIRIAPEQAEVFYFNRGLRGRLAVKGGEIKGRDISVNWTLPKFARQVTVTKVEGIPSILQAVPVTLPHPPYKEIPNKRQTVNDRWTPPVTPQGSTEHYWVIQVRFDAEATIRIEAELAPQ
jgi:hypothetical protein